ncbi:MAG: DNA-binding protein WhiA [Clostridia bacterium]|nr:DNA-binding protein WhiA [Clostridia bacterium]
MSFSKDIKEELSKLNTLANKECVKFELIGYLISNNTSVIKGKIKYSTENEYNINRLNKLLNNLKIDYKIELQGKVYTITFKKLEMSELLYLENKIQIQNIEINVKKDELFLKSLVRGCFLGSGSLNNPNSKYHLEILLSTSENASFILEVLKAFGIEVKILARKNSTSIYIKEAEEISKLLALIGAGKSVLNFEEIRVVRDTRNNINRLVNCETANLNKTINASVEQIKQIKYLKEKRKFDALPDTLKEIANLRQKNPDASLVELGAMLENPIGKSGVNHRLKKICEIAEEVRKNMEK